jgi:hypothetical protein
MLLQRRRIVLRTQQIAGCKTDTANAVDRSLTSAI